MKLNYGRIVTLPLLLLNFAMFIIVLGLSGHFLNDAIGGSAGGNAATTFFITFALVAGVVGCASVIAGLYHLKVWKSETLAATNAVTWVSWVLVLLAMGLAWKEIHIGGRSTKHRVLEAFVIILSFTQLLYLMLLHLGVFGATKYGPSYGEPVVASDVKVTTPATTASPAAASAV
ncbi:hypothetical protein Mapa_000448 [Marchantia paleacea]|nr:hypothetical protein Mapa_000448 [Marchantia paleacea]